MSLEDIQKTLSLLFSPGQVAELRALRKSGGMASGYYTDYQKLARDAEILDTTGDISGIYVILNEINPVLFSRRANRIEMRLSRDDKTTGDDDIIRRRWLPIDIDPKRPSGISSSEEEHEESLRKAERIRGFLTEMGWPAPICADSGNGAHLLYQIDLPSDSASTELIKQALSVISAFFSDEISDIDTSVSNAARLWKLYGTMAKKGDSVPERPHRRSGICFSPDRVEVVSSELLIRLAALLSPPPETIRAPRRRSQAIDLGDWLLTHGLSFREKTHSCGRLFVFDQCPFSSAHIDGAYAIQFDSGAIFAGCHHNTCGGGTQRWSELRERYEGPLPKRDPEKRLKQIAHDRTEARAAYYGTVPGQEKSDRGAADASKMKPDNRQDNHSGQECPGPDGASEDISPDVLTDIAQKATDILRDGDPIAFIKDSIAIDHEGDDVVAASLIMSFASRSVLNSNGLHVLVTGESGKGKSHIFDTMIQHAPPEFRLDGRLSDKALYYTEGLNPGTAICLDDVSLSEQMQETLKGVTTSFRKPFVYRTVNKERKGQICIIPERCVWWVAKVDGTGDDQVWNRMLTCWIDDSAEQDDKVLVRELAAAEEFPVEFTETRKEVLVCHQIWNQVKPVYVVIPYAKQIRFTSSTNRRNPGMLLDIIKSYAALHQYQRECVQQGGCDVVIADKEDFMAASQIYQALNGESGGQSTKLTKSESMVIEAIRTSGQREFTMKELVDRTGKTYDAIRKLIKGNGKNSSHNGLLEKCPAITYLQRTDTIDAGSKTQLVYVWNEAMYLAWSSGGRCWLSSQGNEDYHTRHDGDGDDGGDGNCDCDASGNDRGLTDLVTGETGACQRPIGENFSPQKESQNEKDSKNNRSNNSFYNDRRKYPGAEQGDEPEHEQDHGCVSTPQHFLRSTENVDTKAILGPVRKMEQKSTGEEFSPVFSDRPFFSPVTPIPSPVTIDPDEYGPINGVWSGPCKVCGGKWIHYTEKFSAKMKEEGRFSHKVCQKCYDLAVLRKSGTFTTLPGLLNTANMVRTHTDVGRCQVCNTGAAVWVDPDTKDKLCENCYSRERTETGVRTPE